MARINILVGSIYFFGYLWWPEKYLEGLDKGLILPLLVTGIVAVASGIILQVQEMIQKNNNGQKGE